MQKKSSIHILIICLFLSIISNTFGVSIEEKMNKIIYERDLDFKNVPLSDILGLLSKSSGITIVADSQATNTNVDLYFGKGQSLGEVIRTIKVTQGLNSREVNNVLILGKSISGFDEKDSKIIGRIISKRTGEGIEGAKVYIVGQERFFVRSEIGGNFILKNLEPGTYILKVEKDSFKTNGEILEVEPAKIHTQDIVLDSLQMESTLVDEKKESNLQNTRNLGVVVNADGKKESTEKIRLRHALPSDIKTILATVVPKLEITAVENQHIVVLRGADENVEIARKLIEELDIPVKQVRITAQILEVTGELSENLGIDWSFDSRDTPTTPSAGEGLLGGMKGGSPTLNFVSFLKGGSDIIDVTLNMLQETRDASLAAIPSIIALNGEKARISVSSEQNVGKIRKTDDDGNTIEEPLFKEAGTLLSITPLIRDGDGEADSITLEIETELSNFLEASIAGTSNFVGAAQKNFASTRVRVEDGGVIFIGGLQRTDVTNTETKVPFLGSIPFLGRLFKSERVVNKRKDLYIQIKAEIVTDENRNDDISTEGFRIDQVNIKDRMF